MRLPTIVLGLALLPLAAAAQDVQDLGDRLRARVETTLGSFVMELDRVRAPLTVAAFVEYAREGHYEGTLFHRVVPGFVAQGGGYTREMTLKPVERNVFNESGNGLSNLRGTVGLARTGDPHSGTSQFYVNLADNLDLNPRPTRWGYAVFGRIVEGMETVDTIGDVPTDAGGPFDRNVPVTPVVIERVVLLND